MNNKINIGLISSFHELSKQYHQDCLDSILKQTENNFHFYLFSEDLRFGVPKVERPKIIYEYVHNLSPRQIKTRGVQKAYHDGCQYVCFIDSDDIMSENKMDTIMNYIKEFNVDIFIHNLNTIDSAGKLIKSRIFNFEDEVYENSYYWDKNNAGFGNTIYKTEIIYNILPFHEISVTLDWEIINILSLDRKVYTLDESLIDYRQHENNSIGISGIINKQWLSLQLNIRDKHYDALDYYFQMRQNKHALYNLHIQRTKWIEKKDFILSDIDGYLSELQPYKEKLLWQELV
jgi:hypothetical protein